MTQPQGQSGDYLLSAKSVRFRRDGDGTVRMEGHGQERVVAGVQGAFPLTRPAGMVSLRDDDGREIGLLDDVGALDRDSRRIVREELDRAYFMPRIEGIEDIKEALSVVEWRVVTNRGPRTFVVRHVRKNVRRIGPRRYMVKDVDGNRYEIRDCLNLPPAAQKLIEPYL